MASEYEHVIQTFLRTTTGELSQHILWREATEDEVSSKQRAGGRGPGAGDRVLRAAPRKQRRWASVGLA